MQIPKVLGPADISPEELTGAMMNRARKIFAIPIFVFVALLAFNAYRGTSLRETLEPAVLALVSLGFFYFTMRSRLRRSVLAIEDTFRNVRWTIGANDLVIESLRSRTIFPWAEQRGCKVEGGMISLHNGGGFRYFFPVRALENTQEATEIAEWIAARIAQARAGT